MTAIYRTVVFRRHGSRGIPAAACSARGAMLLEVLISMGLLVFGMAVVGLQIQTGLDMARSADLGTRAVMLIDTKFAELDAGVLVPESLEGEIDGHFGLFFPGFAWRVTIEPTETRQVFMATVEIKYSQQIRDEQIRNPEYDVDYEDPRFRVIRSGHRLIATPPDVNFERDMGMTPEQVQEISDQIPIPGLDPRSIDPRMLAGLDDELLGELMPLIEQMLGQGGGLDALQNLTQDQRDALQGLQDQMGNGRGGRGARDRGERQRGGDDRQANDGDDQGAGGPGQGRRQGDQGEGRRQR